MNTKRDKMGHTLPLHHQGLSLDDEMLRDEAEHDHAAHDQEVATDGQ